ncbi:MAG: glycosyltransferase [Lachnospiraceae bacterium]|nr:glycosyltransferase [Lachnospiraceae bacterium]
MNIVLYQWKAYQQQDIYETLCSLGHNVICYTEPITNPEEDDNYVEQLVTFLRSNPAEVLFSINYFPVLSDACKITDILYVAWTCDSPLLGLHHQSVFHSCNRIFLFDRKDYETLRVMGVENCYYLPLGACVERLNQHFPVTKEQYDISFVGNLYTHNSYDDIASSLPSYLCGYLDCALEAQLHSTAGNILPTLLSDSICEQLESVIDYQKSPRSNSDVRLLFSTTVLGFKAASLERMEALQRLAFIMRRTDTHVHLFSEDTELTLPFVTCHGPVDYHAELPGINKNSLINLNMTIPNIQTGLPLRIWDIMGCGGFLLTNLQSEIPEMFEIGKELETFETNEELIQKCRFYLEHDDARMQIAKQGYEAVKKQHTLRQRLTGLLTQVGRTS